MSESIDEYSLLSGRVQHFYRRCKEAPSEAESISVAVAQSSPESLPSMFYGTESSASRTSNSNEEELDVSSTGNEDDEEMSVVDEETSVVDVDSSIVDVDSSIVDEDFDREIVFSSKSPPSTTSPKKFSNSSIRDRLNDVVDQIYDYVECAGVERWVQKGIKREYRRYRRLINSSGPMRLSKNTLYRLSKYSPNKSPIHGSKLRFSPVAHVPTTPISVYQRGTKLEFTPVAHFPTTPMQLYKYEVPVAAGFPARDSSSPRRTPCGKKTQRVVEGMAKAVMKPRRLLS